MPRMITILILMSFTLPAAAEEGLAAFFAERVVSLESGGDLDPLIEEAGERRLALLGEASHGTQEFYTWRTEISKRLIEEQGYSFIAVEGDWASLYRLNKFVKGLPGAPESAREGLEALNRWPEWMWGNTAVEELVTWLRQHNEGLPLADRIGFYGMDVYGPWDALDDLLVYTETHLAEHHESVVGHYACFDAYNRDERHYAQAMARGGDSCEASVVSVVSLLREHGEALREADARAYFRAKQNALVMQNVEEHFRTAGSPGPDSWNTRATHMWVTVQRLLEHYGEDAKGIVWAHNTHVGDARATTMAFQGMVNIGQLSREAKGADAVFITGFGTYSGEVNAGLQWGAPMQVMRVPDAMQGSVEAIFGELEPEVFYVRMDDAVKANAALQEPRGHRAIGVVFDPRGEARNYVPTVLPERYDGFIFIRHTNALEPVK